MLDRAFVRGAVAGVLACVLSAQTILAETPPRITPDQMNSIVNKLRPSQAMGWAKIPWAGSLVDARQVSQRENVPVFLFVLDGNLAAGRC